MAFDYERGNRVSTEMVEDGFRRPHFDIRVCLWLRLYHRPHAGAVGFGIRDDGLVLRLGF